MKSSKLKYLSLLGLFGLAGLFTGNYGLFGLFGFFAFAGLASMTNDELLQKNLGRAGLNAFVVSLIGLVIAITILPLVDSKFAAPVFIAVIYTVQILTFVVSFNVYEKRGDR